MPAPHDARDWIGWRVDDVYGARVGKLEDIHEDEEGRAWGLVNTTRFGAEYAVVPLLDAIAGQGHVWVPYERALIRSGSLGLGSEEARARGYFGLGRTAAAQH